MLSTGPAGGVEAIEKTMKEGFWKTGRPIQKLRYENLVVRMLGADAGDLDLDQLSGDRTVFVSRPDDEFVSRFFVDRYDASAMPLGDAEHAENAIILTREFSDDLPFERVCVIAGRP